MSENKDWHDVSDYPYNPTLYKQENKIGKFKDELNGVVIEEFIGLRPVFCIMERLETMCC